MTRAEFCRSKAEECEQMARTTRNPKIRSQLEKLAADWRALADQLDKAE
jgi:hypothetical protein